MESSEYKRSYRLEDRHWWFVSRRRLAAALLTPRLQADPRRQVLDIGCGTGRNLSLLRRWGRVTGLDVNALPLTFARRRQAGQLAQASALHLPFPADTFGLVTAFDVLYHRRVTHDQQALAEIRRILQPGGWLLMTDSAMPLLWSSHDQLYHARQRYSLPEMRAKLSEAGFALDVCSYANALLLPLALMVRLLMRSLPLRDDVDLRPLPGWLNQLFIASRGLETAWLRRGHRLPVGSSLVCMARKTTGDERRITMEE